MASKSAEWSATPSLSERLRLEFQVLTGGAAGSDPSIQGHQPPTSASRSHSRPGSLADQIQLELADRGKHVEQQPTRWHARVDPLVHNDQVHPERLELARGLREVPRGAGQPVQLHDSDRIEAAPLGLRHHLVQCRPSIPGATDPVVNVLLDDFEPPSGGISAQVVELRADGLLARRDASIESDSYRCTPSCRLCYHFNIPDSRVRVWQRRRRRATVAGERVRGDRRSSGSRLSCR